MNKFTQKLIRILVAGSLTAVLLYSLCYPSVLPRTFVDALAAGGFFTFFVIAVGYLYEVANIRGLLLKSRWKRTDCQVIESFINLLNNDEKSRARDIPSNKFMLILWHLVDHDETLRTKSSTIRISGIAISSTADAIVTSWCLIVLQTIWFAVDRNPARVFWIFGGMIAIALGQIFLLDFFIRKHQEQIEDQLNYVELYKKSEVQTKIRECM